MWLGGLLFYLPALGPHFFWRSPCSSQVVGRRGTTGQATRKPRTPHLAPYPQGDTVLNNLSGVGALQDALATTNALLADVLAELKETNSLRLQSIAEELRTLNQAGDAGPGPMK